MTDCTNYDHNVHDYADLRLARLAGASEPRQPQVAAREYAAKIKAECDALVKACDRYMVMFFDRQAAKE